MEKKLGNEPQKEKWELQREEYEEGRKNRFITVIIIGAVLGVVGGVIENGGLDEILLGSFVYAITFAVSWYIIREFFGW